MSPLRPTAPTSSPGVTTRSARVAAAIACLAVALVGCSSSAPSPEELDFEEYDAVVEQIAEALEAEGVLRPASIEYAERSAQFEDGRCRLFAQDADATTVETQPSAEEVAAAVDPVLADTGFDAVEEDEAEGGHLKLTSTDEHGARLQILWKASELDVTLEADVDLEESACRVDATR